MVNIELYLNDRLADVGNDFSIRLNRQLINPGELNIKDAQYSYSVNLPPTKNNNEIFRYANVEEVGGKFTQIISAELTVNGVRIFVGRFRISNINARGFKGNLYVPQVKTIKDIFGAFNLNEIPEYRIPFADFAGSINAINTAAKTATQDAIFPYVLYGLLPKEPLNKNANTYSPREIWDESVRIGIQDLPPSINTLKMLKHLFESQGYVLGGTAFNDSRLTKLYQSYKNPSDFVQPWNYGYHAKMKLNGSWSSVTNKRGGAGQSFERGVNQSFHDGVQLYTTDLLDAVNSKITVTEDPGGNILYREILDEDGVTWVQSQIRVPVSGFYRVKFGASVKVLNNNNWRATDPKTGIQQVSGRSDKANNDFGGHINEVRLVRDRRNADFGLQAAKLDSTFYYDNQPQNQIFDETNIPKYFPKLNTEGQINFIDLAQDANHVLGFGFGLRPGDRSGDTQYQNPRDTANTGAQMQAAKPAVSWDTREGSADFTKLAVNAPGYWKYGRIGNFDNEGDNPDENISYASGTRTTNRIFDANGNPITDAGAANFVILERFPVSRFYTYEVNGGASYEGKLYVHAQGETVPRQVVDFVGGIATFDTSSFNTFDPDPEISFYLATDDFDVDGTLIINRSIEADSEDVVGWEETSRYKIELTGAPANTAARGRFNGATASADWNGQGNINAVVWFDAGELLSVASVSSEGRYRRSGMHSTYGLVNHEVIFNLEIEPFRVDLDWLKVNYKGSGTAVMDWGDPINFDTDSINLAGFLPSDMKANDFIDNFVKAFNLKLYPVEQGVYNLDVKQTVTSISDRFVDLDGVASVLDRENTSLGLPSLYKIGFTINPDEEGFFITQDDGGGEISTGVIEDKVIEQKSNFSFNWFKGIVKEKGGNSISLSLPVISKHEVWLPETPYPEAMLKRFTDLPMRFWYFDDLLNDSGATFDFNGGDLKLAKVSNSIIGKSILNYKNKPFTILDNFFTLLVNSSSHFTEVDAYLTPIQYQDLDGSRKAKFNGDIYLVAEIKGYDPTGRNKSIINLIRKI